MAATALWPVRDRVRAVIAYVRDPGKTADADTGTLENLHAAGPAERYVSGEKRTYVTCLNCTERDAADQFEETQRLWSVILGEDRTTGRVSYHGFQSFREGEVTAETAHEIGVKLAERLWGDRYEVVVATHCDTDHYHNHFVFNAVSFVNGHKYGDKRSDKNAVREESNRICREYGLSVIEEPFGKRRPWQEYAAAQEGKPTLHSLIRADIDRAAAASVTAPEFFRSLERMGYELSLYDSDGRPLRCPALRPPGAEGFFGFHKLGGREYTLEEILERVADNYRRRVPFPESERRILRAYRERYQPRGKASGLYALYLKYCFELHILVKHPASVRQLPFSVREDLIRLDRLDAQARFLAENGIGTVGDLNAFRESREREYGRVKETWAELVRAEQRKETARDPERLAGVKEKRAEAGRKMRKIRQEIRLCGEIEERSRTMEDRLQLLSKEQILTDEGREDRDEHVFERGGGTGRPHDAGRG